MKRRTFLQMLGMAPAAPMAAKAAEAFPPAKPKMVVGEAFWFGEESHALDVTELPAHTHYFGDSGGCYSGLKK